LIWEEFKWIWAKPECSMQVVEHVEIVSWCVYVHIYLSFFFQVGLREKRKIHAYSISFVLTYLLTYLYLCMGSGLVSCCFVDQKVFFYTLHINRRVSAVLPCVIHFNKGIYCIKYCCWAFWHCIHPRMFPCSNGTDLEAIKDCETFIKNVTMTGIFFFLSNTIHLSKFIIEALCWSEKKRSFFRLVSIRPIFLPTQYRRILGRSKLEYYNWAVHVL